VEYVTRDKMSSFIAYKHIEGLPLNILSFFRKSKLLPFCSFPPYVFLSLSFIRKEFMWERLSLRSLKDRYNHRVDWVSGRPAEPVRFNNYDIYFSLMLSMQNYILASHLHKRTRLLGYMKPHEFYKLQTLNLHSLLHIYFQSFFLKYYYLFFKKIIYLKI